MSFSYTQIDYPTGKGPFTFKPSYTSVSDVVVMGFNGKVWSVLPIDTVVGQDVTLKNTTNSLLAIRISNNAAKVNNLNANGNDGNVLDENSTLSDEIRIKLLDMTDQTGSFPMTPEAITIAGLRKAILSPDVAVGQRADFYSSLIDGTEIGQLAYCNQSEGTKWLPNDVGGTYHPAGWYLWNGTEWVSDRNNIAEQLHLNVTSLSTKSDVGHAHNKSDIVDFNEADYAAFEQGVLADTSLQPNDNITELNNNAGYITAADTFSGNYNDLSNLPTLFSGNYSSLVGAPELETQGLANYYNEFTYSNGNLMKIETYNSAAKTTKRYTKNFTYTDGALTQISTTNETTNTTTIKTLAYDQGGNLTSVTK